MAADNLYTKQQIKEHLQQHLPLWYHEDEWICRKYKTSSWKGTLMVINTVGHLAEAAWHHPELEVSFNYVVVKLTNHHAKGITDKDFELANKIEEVVQWQPGKQDSALSGTPDDPLHRYVKYD